MIEKARESLKDIKQLISTIEFGGTKDKQVVNCEIRDIEQALDQASNKEKNFDALVEKYLELEKENEALKDYKMHYQIYQDKVAYLTSANKQLNEDCDTATRMIESLEDRNDRLVKRLERQKTKIKELEGW